MKRLLLWMVLIGLLEAGSCRDLCDRFGAYEACQKAEQGIAECPHRLEKAPRLAGESADRSSAKGFVIMTRRDGSCAFRVSVARELMRYEAVGCGDYYGVSFDGRSLGDDHVLDINMRCRRLGPGSYECRGRYGEYRYAIVRYRIEGAGRFDWSFYGADRKRRGRPGLEYRLYSDGKYLYEQFFDRGRLRRDISKRYPIRDIVDGGR
jgi:hypothetical protein